MTPDKSQERALVKNASDPQQVKDAATRETLARRDELDDVRHVMSTAQGRRFVWRLLHSGKLLESCFTENSIRMAFLEGCRNQATKLFADIDAACPELFDKMRQEAREAER